MMSQDPQFKGPLDEIFDLEEKAVEHLPVPKKEKAKILAVLDLIVNIIIIVALVVLVRKYLLSPFQVYGPSMCNTMNYINNGCQRGFGEYLIVNKAVYHNFFGIHFGKPERGDIIIFRPPGNEEEFFIKRIIGLPGETVIIDDGKVSIQKDKGSKPVELSEPYLSENAATKTYSQQHWFTVPEGYYFVLGDNRPESSDSRTCFGTNGLECADDSMHFLAFDRIEGKAWLVLWPFANLRVVHDPVYENLL